jgi:hypothetical protein
MRKLKCVFPEYKEIERQFTWNPNWVSLYESPWGIFEKFKYANCITVREILSLLGNEEVLSTRTISCSQQNCNLIDMDRLNNESIINVLKLDVKSRNQEFMYLMTFVPRHRPYQDFFRKQLTFCLTCMKNGFHSILNQFSLVYECPIHGGKLLDQCPKCNKAYPYRLGDDTFTAPFQCSCGYQYLNSISNYSEAWEFNPVIRSSEVTNWIALYNKQKINFDNLILSSEISFRNLQGGMDFILQAVEPSYKSIQPEKHYVVKSPSRIMLYGNYYKEFESIRESGSDERYLKFIEKINEIIYQSNRSTFYAIAKHLRTTILQSHIACVRKLELFEIKCPYAFAYVNWRKFIEGHTHTRQVDNKYRPGRQQIKYEMEFISKQDDSALWDIVTKWEYGRPYKKYKHLTATIWIINRVLAHFALNHFYSWFEIARNTEKLNIEYNSVPFFYENVPFFLIKLPRDNEKELEFHWWLSDQHRHKPDLKCPF